MGAGISQVTIREFQDFLSTSAAQCLSFFSWAEVSDNHNPHNTGDGVSVMFPINLVDLGGLQAPGGSPETI